MPAIRSPPVAASTSPSCSAVTRPGWIRLPHGSRPRWDSRPPAAGVEPNELLDQRDQLLQQIVQRTGATVTGQQGSGVVVSLGGATLVQGEQANSLDLAAGPTLSVVFHGSGEPVAAAGGELGA